MSRMWLGKTRAQAKRRKSNKSGRDGGRREVDRWGRGAVGGEDAGVRVIYSMRAAASVRTHAYKDDELFALHDVHAKTTPLEYLHTNRSPLPRWSRKVKGARRA